MISNSANQNLDSIELQQKDVRREQGECCLNVEVAGGVPAAETNGQNMDSSKTNLVEQKKISKDYFWRFVAWILRFTSIVSHRGSVTDD